MMRQECITRLCAVAAACALVAASIPAITQAAPSASASSTPLMNVLDRFTASDVPALGPAEIAVSRSRNTNAVVGVNLPGKGLAQHPMPITGEGLNIIFLVNDGKVIWTYQTGGGWEYDDIWMLSNGNILITRMQYIAVVTPKKEVIWRYDAPSGTEIHGCQPIGQDKVFFVQNGLPPKVIIANIKTKEIVMQHDLPCQSLTNKGTVHAQFRRIRYTAQETYLVPFLSMNKVVEYDKNWKEVWRYDIRAPWAAIRLKNGNTLITDESENLTREVNPKKETVWEFSNTDLPVEYRFLSAPQSCTRLANGNTIFCSRGNGKGPQMVEVTPDKKVVWVMQDYRTFGPVSAVQVLDDPGIPENPGESEH